jgi:hypothetical protein
MSAYEYKIGTSQATLALLSTLGVPAPRHGFVPTSVETSLGDGSVRGNGWPEDEWFWGFLTGSQRATLRTYVPSMGAQIYIRDLKDDGLTYKDFLVQAVWMRQEDRQNGRRMGFTLRFRAMVELEDL